MVETTVSAFGPVDILVNNAGSLVERLRLLELTEARWDEVMNLNLIRENPPHPRHPRTY